MNNWRNKLGETLESLDLTWMILGFAYLGIYSYQVIAEPTQAVYQTLENVNTVIYSVFALDLVLRAVVLGKKLFTIGGFILFWKKNWLSILAVVLPAFRSLRVLRVVLVMRAFEPYLHTRSHKLAVITLITMPLLMFTSAVAAYEAERYVEGSNITNFGDAIWWSLVSITTVGYGDFFPVTFQGRIISSLLLIVGIGLFSSLTALLAAWVIAERKSSDAS
jgi:voltage-gated potassium channel